MFVSSEQRLGVGGTKWLENDIGFSFNYLCGLRLRYCGSLNVGSNEQTVDNYIM